MCYEDRSQRRDGGPLSGSAQPRRRSKGEEGRAMLYLTRKKGESVMIDGVIEVTVVGIHGKSVKLGFTYPEGTRVLRREVFERIQLEKSGGAAPSTTGDESA